MGRRREERVPRAPLWGASRARLSGGVASLHPRLLTSRPPAWKRARAGRPCDTRARCPCHGTGRPHHGTRARCPCHGTRRRCRGSLGPPGAVEVVGGFGGGRLVDALDEVAEGVDGVVG